MIERIHSHRDLIVYQKSFAAGRRVFEISKSFPREEMYSLTDQFRRSARSVSANIAEAWRRRRYEKHFCSTLNIAEAEAAETQVWLDYAAAHDYIDEQTAQLANAFYDEIIRMLVAMIIDSEKWCLNKSGRDKERRRGGDKESGSGGVNEQKAKYETGQEYIEIDQYELLSLSPDSPSPDSPSPDSSTPN